MDGKFILSCGSTVDLPYSYMERRGIPVIFYSYVIDDVEYEDDMCRNPEALPRFYGLLEQGKLPSTSQVNEYSYEAFFEEQLKRGDLLHIAFGSGMTPSVKNAQKAAETLRAKYPDRRIEVVDSLCSCAGYGLFVDAVADMRDAGRTLDETLDWVMENRWNLQHHFFSTDLQYFRRSGRMSGAAAAVGTILGICPIMRLDDKGKIIAYDKVRGKAAAIRRMVDAVEKHATGGVDYSGKCFLAHSNCLETAERAKAALDERFPRIDGGVRLLNIGTIIASHCGPGTVSVYFFGDKRAPYPEK